MRQEALHHTQAPDLSDGFIVDLWFFYYTSWQELLQPSTIRMRTFTIVFVYDVVAASAFILFDSQFFSICIPTTVSSVRITLLYSQIDEHEHTHTYGRFPLDSSCGQSATWSRTICTMALPRFIT